MIFLSASLVDRLPMPLSSVSRRKDARLASNALLAMLVLLTLEGAFRKWVSAGLTIPLVGCRDLLALFFVLYGWKNGYLRSDRAVSGFALAWAGFVLIWGLLQVLLGYSDLFTLGVGLRFWCLYVLFGVAIGHMIDTDGVVRFVKFSLCLLMAMAPLAIVQFLSPPGAIINKQVEGDESSVFVVAMDIVRTTGTFSFTAGYTTLLGLLTPIVLAVAMERRAFGVASVMAYSALAALAACSAVSGSRGAVLFFAAFLVMSAMLGLLVLRMNRKGRPLAMLLVAVGLTAGILLLLPDIVASMAMRFEQASESEDLGMRIVTSFIGDSHSLSILTWHGLGIGAGSALTTFLSGGARAFVAGEVENGRVLAEAGVFGAMCILLKIGAALAVFWIGFRRSLREQRVFPALVALGFVYAMLTWSVTFQLTIHGLFGVYVALAIAALRMELFESPEVLQSNRLP